MLLKDIILQSLSNWKQIHVAECLLIAAFISFWKGIDKKKKKENRKKVKTGKNIF